MKTIVLGPPGTGKTTTLLNQVDGYLKKTDPDKVGYFSFTQKAAYEARDRAIKKFNLTEDDLPYFRTLHSLAFKRLGIQKQDVMQKSHYADLGDKLGFPVGYAKYEDDHSGRFTTDSEYLRIINLAKLRNITAEQQFDLAEHNQDLERDKLRIIANEIERYKKEHSLIDFNDMILDFIKSDKSPKFDVVFIDEAQDLSLMQWDMAKSIWNKTTDSYIAGDDDQAIFRWAGADVDSFIAQKGLMMPLTNSYRIPALVHVLAMHIINKVNNRIPKNWKPKMNAGALSKYDEFEQINMKTGEWLVLARTKYMLKDLEETLYLNGLYYRNKFKKTKEQDLHYAAVDWENLRKGVPLSYKQVERIYGYMKDNTDKTKLKGMLRDGSYNITILKQSYGLKTDAPWFEAFDDAPSRDVNYLRKMRKNGEKLNEAPRITLSTIHGAKGGEAENVVLLTDLSRNTYNAYQKNPDDENRLFYVGATRTKEHLHIISPKQEYTGYTI